MAESMQGLKRSHRCTEVSSANIGEKVTVMGWVQKSRNKGGIIFVDLRDRSGILQVIFEESQCGAECFEKAGKLRSEFVAAIEGTVCKRAGAVNENLATGDIEVVASSLRILSEAETPPFPIEENSKTKEEIRLKYRYLDLRRPDLQRNLIMKSKVATIARRVSTGIWMSLPSTAIISMLLAATLSVLAPVDAPQAITVWARLSPGTVTITLSVSRTCLPVWDCLLVAKPTMGGLKER